MKKNFGKWLRKFDIFGKKINLTTKGAETFTTTLGGVFSILFIMGLTAYGLVSFQRVWLKEVKSVQTQTVYKDPKDPATQLDLTNTNFKFGFGFKDLVPPQIGSLQALYIVANKTSNEKSIQELPLSICDKSLGFEQTYNLMCLDDEHYKKDPLVLRGNLYTDEFRYIEILFLPCSENSQAEV